MKKALIASVLGLAFTAVSSFGQGQVFFNTYVGTVYQPIKYAVTSDGHTAGETVGSGFSAQLYYGLGSGLSFNQLSLVPGSTTAVGTQVAGYVTGGIVTIPGYSSGPVTFAVVAFTGASWDSTLSGFATSSGNVATWTEASVASGQNPAGFFQVNVPAITVSPASVVPEPSMLALAGLGSAALLAFRRRNS